MINQEIYEIIKIGFAKIIEDINHQIKMGYPSLEINATEVLKEIEKEIEKEMKKEIQEYHWTNIETGQIHDKLNKKCPYCENQLHTNRYKDLHVAANQDDISMCINMAYCDRCDYLFIRSDA